MVSREQEDCVASLKIASLKISFRSLDVVFRSRPTSAVYGKFEYATASPTMQAICLFYIITIMSHGAK